MKELAALNENAVLGWRFWAAFLGLGYLSGTMIIPNMKLRLEDILATTYTENSNIMRLFLPRTSYFG